jgi:hypothetical protein
MSDVHRLKALNLVPGPPEFGRPVLRVINARDLRSALAQSEHPILIENQGMARLFQNIEFWRTTRLVIIALAMTWIMHQAVTHKYKIEISVLRNWKIETTEGKVILSPTQ